MTPQQIALVRSSFAQLARIVDSAASLFYAHLFHRDPSLRALFRGDMAHQGRRLMEMIGWAVERLDRPDALRPALHIQRQVPGDRSQPGGDVAHRRSPHRVRACRRAEGAPPLTPTGPGAHPARRRIAILARLDPAVLILALWNRTRGVPRRSTRSRRIANDPAPGLVAVPAAHPRRLHPAAGSSGHDCHDPGDGGTANTHFPGLRRGTGRAGRAQAEASAEPAPSATPDVPVGPEPVAGVDYVEIAGGQPFEPAAGKIEVAEAFSYSCPHCAQFEPMLLSWRARQPADVKFTPGSRARSRRSTWPSARTRGS